MLTSIVIRTLDDARYLGELLEAIGQQDTGPFQVEVVVIDSGSTDGTLEIAEKHGCTITHITREQFSFGRSLNMGCEVARGEILVLISGHCVPTDRRWLRNLCQPIADGLSTTTTANSAAAREATLVKDATSGQGDRRDGEGVVRPG